MQVIPLLLILLGAGKARDLCILFMSHVVTWFQSRFLDEKAILFIFFIFYFYSLQINAFILHKPYIYLFSGMKNPLTLMSYLTPVMTLVTALLSVILEPWSEFKENSYFNSQWHVFRSCLLMLFGGALAFFMVTTLNSFSFQLFIYSWGLWERGWFYKDMKFVFTGWDVCYNH